jgi:hypothetical protein
LGFVGWQWQFLRDLQCGLDMKLVKTDSEYVLVVRGGFGMGIMWLWE